MRLPNLAVIDCNSVIYYPLVTGLKDNAMDPRLPAGFAKHAKS
jgi:hypothetical protein